MGAMKELYMDTVYKGCDLLFDWNEQGCRALSEVYDEDYRPAIKNHGRYNTPSNLANVLMIDGILLDDEGRYDVKRATRIAMRNMLEYASDFGSTDMCYTTAEMLDQFDDLFEFYSLMD